MLRTALILLATLLASGAIVLARQIPVKADMKGSVTTLIGLSFFFTMFFAVVRFVDDYFWWTVPAVSFIAAFIYGFRRLDDINRLIRREGVTWLTETLASAPITGAYTKGNGMHKEPDLLNWDEEFRGLVPPDEEPPPRRFMDNFLIADEADLGPGELDLEHLDDFIFTARHGYLVHDQNPDRAPCDVMTISPGMSIADLIEAAKQHQCVKENA
jgi:hypothetical protein